MNHSKGVCQILFSSKIGMFVPEMEDGHLDLLASLLVSLLLVISIVKFTSYRRVKGIRKRSGKYRS